MKTYMNYINSLIFKLLPETKAFRFKRFLLRLAGIQIGANSRVCSSVVFLGNGEIKIGDNVWIGPETMLISSSKIIIEDNVDIAPRVFIGTGTHVLADIPGRMAGTGLSKDIIVKEGSWIGSNVVIQPGVTIQYMNFVNSGAVVTKNFEKYCLLAGIPAKRIKKLRE